MTISHAADLWLGELERHNHSVRTIDTYRRLLDKLYDAYASIDVDEVTATQIRRFLDEQARKRDGSRKAPATIAQNVSIVNGFLDWLTSEGVIRRNPVRRNGERVLSRPKQIAPDENDNVVTVNSAEVELLMKAADESGKWNKRLAVYALAYLGPRRRALSNVRLSDYDQDERTLSFREKGGVTIRKPVPDMLADLIDSAILAGIYDAEDSYLIPGVAEQRRPGDRDDRVIWRLVKEVAGKAGVTTHVHALRAAFAVEFLRQNPGQIVALQKLLGHKRIETTMIYLRRLNRMQAMETVRPFTWGTHIAPRNTSVLPVWNPCKYVGILACNGEGGIRTLVSLQPA
jgi:integrase/recombinase XerC